MNLGGVEVLGGMGDKTSNSGTQYFQQDRIYNKDTICPALNSSGEQLVPKIIDCVAMRGRGEHNMQQLEINQENISNAITTVQKDNMVLIRQNTKDGLIPCKIGGGGGFGLSFEQDKTRPCNRERRDMSDTNDGEYP